MERNFVLETARAWLDALPPPAHDGKSRTVSLAAYAREFRTLRLDAGRRQGHSTAACLLAAERPHAAAIFTPNVAAISAIQRAARSFS